MVCTLGAALAATSACQHRGYNRSGEVTNVYQFREVTLTPEDVFRGLVNQANVNQQCLDQARAADRRRNTRNAREMFCYLEAFQKQYVYNTSATNELEANQARNLAVDRVLFASDMNCDNYYRGLRDLEVGRTGVTGTLNKLAEATGTAVSDAATSRFASGTTLFLSIVNDNFGNAAFQGKTIAILAEQNEIDRQAMRRELEQEKAKTYNEWTVYAAIADAYKYNSACNIGRTLESLDRTVADAKTLAESRSTLTQEVNKAAEAAAKAAEAAEAAAKAAEAATNPTEQINNGTAENDPSPIET